MNAHNCEVCVSTSEFSSEIAKERLSYYDKYSCADAVVLIDTDIDESTEFIVPIVSVKSKVKNPKVLISSNTRETVEQSVYYFLERGITDIVYVGENLTINKNEIFREISENILGKSDDSSIFLTEKRFEDGGYSLAISQALSGVAGFVATLCISGLVTYIQKNGNELFGINVYAQQVASLIALIFTVAAMIYVTVFIIGKKDVKASEKL